MVSHQAAENGREKAERTDHDSDIRPLPCCERAIMDMSASVWGWHVSVLMGELRQFGNGAVRVREDGLDYSWA